MTEPWRTTADTPRRRSNVCSWSWGESNPRPPGGDRTRYDHSRTSASTATELAGQRISEEITAGSFPDVSGLSRRQWSFPTVHPRFCCRAAWIWPRAPLLVTILLFYLLKKIRRRERTAHFWRFIWCPRLTSLKQLGSQTRLPGPNVETSQPRDCIHHSIRPVRLWRLAGSEMDTVGPIDRPAHARRRTTGDPP